MAALLTSHGFATTYACDAPAAHALLTKGPHWMILDLKLDRPGDGLDLLRRVRSERLETRIALITAEVNQERLAEAREMKPDIYLPKPVSDVNLKVLLDKLTEPLGGSGEHEQIGPAGPSAGRPGG
jgi:CheY-like chemotaxis protein